MIIDKFYAGIGSRQTPRDVLLTMKMLAVELAQRSFILRTGGADGADAAFEEGCNEGNGTIEKWLPWRNFNNHFDGLYPTQHHVDIASTVHPRWKYLTTGVKKLHSRNVGQILGSDVDTPVSFVVCWTPDGCINEKTLSKDTGGTGTAIVLASRLWIPVFNLANTNALTELNNYIRTNHI